MIPRYAQHMDANKRAVVAALKSVGASVTDLNPDGKDGIPDLLVGFRGVNYLQEVKRAAFIEERKVKGGFRSYKRKGGKLSEAQEKWHQAWRGRPVDVVRSGEEALTAIGCRFIDGRLQLPHPTDSMSAEELAWTPSDERRNAP